MAMIITPIKNSLKLTILPLPAKIQNVEVYAKKDPIKIIKDPKIIKMKLLIFKVFVPIPHYNKIYYLFINLFYYLYRRN